MKTRLHHFINGDWKGDESSINPAKCQLVFAFGSSDQLLLPENLDPIRSAYPNADLVTASTAGEIIRDGVYDNSIVATAIELEQSTLKCVQTHISEHVSSFDAGLFLKEQLQSDDLSGIFIISDGTHGGRQ